MRTLKEQRDEKSTECREVRRRARERRGGRGACGALPRALALRLTPHVVAVPHKASRMDMLPMHLPTPMLHRS